MAAIFFVLFSLTGQAFGQAAESCDSWGVLGAQFVGRARILAGSEKSHFVISPKQSPECIVANAKCQSPEYLVPGDEVLITGHDIAYKLACIHYVSAKGRATSGWMPMKSLDSLGSSVVRLNSPGGYGKWVGGLGNATIEISAGRKDVIFVDGISTAGGNDGLSRRSNILQGAAFVVDDGTTAGLSDIVYRGDVVPADVESDGGVCLTRFRLIGRYLLVDQNEKCVGVGFTSLYVKAK